MKKQGPNSNFGLKFPLIPLIPGIVSLLTIQITYYWAVYNQHVEPFPNIMITQAGLHYPECMLFRAGIIICCVFIVATFHVVAWWLDLINDRTGKYATVNINHLRINGFVSGFLLTFSTATISDGKDMNNTLHLFCASGFFVTIFYGFNTIIGIIKDIWVFRPRIIPIWSYYYKIFVQYAIFILLSLQIVSTIFPHHFDQNIGHYIQWYATYIILMTFITISADMRYVSVYFSLHMCQDYPNSIMMSKF